MWGIKLPRLDLVKNTRSQIFWASLSFNVESPCWILTLSPQKNKNKGLTKRCSNIVQCFISWHEKLTSGLCSLIFHQKRGSRRHCYHLQRLKSQVESCRRNMITARPCASVTTMHTGVSALSSQHAEMLTHSDCFGSLCNFPCNFDFKRDFSQLTSNRRHMLSRIQQILRRIDGSSCIWRIPDILVH